MSHNTMLDQMEPRRKLHYHRDGLDDLLIGLGLLFFGLIIFVDLSWMAGVLAAILVSLWLPLKQGITAPRLRDDELMEAAPGMDPTRTSTLIGGIVLLLGIIFFALIVTDLLSPAAQDWLSQSLEPILGLVAAFFCVFNAELTGSRRYYIYAVLVAAIFGLGSLVGMSLTMMLIGSGSIFLLGGLVLLITFLRTHPRIHRSNRRPQG